MTEDMIWLGVGVVLGVGLTGAALVAYLSRKWYRP
jgi:hypothetical protein